MRLLFLLKEFRQGWGGAPESVRVMANYLCQRGIEADVIDSGFICRDVGRLNLLPGGGELVERINVEATPGYDAILITGPWQNPLGLRRVLAKRRKDQPMYYLPRGGLARIEFAGRADRRKSLISLPSSAGFWMRRAGSSFRRRRNRGRRLRQCTVCGGRNISSPIL